MHGMQVDIYKQQFNNGLSMFISRCW